MDMLKIHHLENAKLALYRALLVENLSQYVQNASQDHIFLIKFASPTVQVLMATLTFSQIIHVELVNNLVELV